MPSSKPSVALCLACSASLPPGRANTKIYYTSCCSRPICPNCLIANPRLARYNPCLRCLAGVNAVNSRSLSGTLAGDGNSTPSRANVDGSVRDEDVFVLGDEDGDESETDSDDEDGRSVKQRAEGSIASATPSEAPPPRTPDYSGSIASHPHSLKSQTGSTADSETAAQGDIQTERGQPPKYYLRPDDTLLGISLRLGVDSRILCRLNNLPPSTLRTTPHLLHTRSYLVLPPSARPPPPLSPTERALHEERRARLALERSETRFQAMTKETDRDVAKAYIAIAGLSDSADDIGDVKEYDKGDGRGLRKRRPHAGELHGEGDTGLEGRAMEQYFDDEDWVSRERAKGRKVAIPSFPVAGPSRVAEKMVAGEQKPWWRWRN
ncbi:hypothetical protein BD310DRAFT_870606 [Dichomitus squalens]|uniref:LysM domain-containing protein n=1 Tax=Dichomitus squalens TaxID=114155 RepID=A0A4Q9Q8Z5_9APHY|nr:hypothetical protein BD310DRAFT_870606 [Dichomitus squalens]